jgi:hypothetical protein
VRVTHEVRDTLELVEQGTGRTFELDAQVVVIVGVGADRAEFALIVPPEAIGRDDPDAGPS